MADESAKVLYIEAVEAQSESRYRRGDATCHATRRGAQEAAFATPADDLLATQAAAFIIYAK